MVDHELPGAWDQLKRSFAAGVAPGASVDELMGYNYFPKKDDLGACCAIAIWIQER